MSLRPNAVFCLPSFNKIKYPRKRLRETLFSRKGLTSRAGTTSLANNSITFTSLGVARTNFTPVDPRNDKSRRSSVMARRSSALLLMYRNNVKLTVGFLIPSIRLSLLWNNHDCIWQNYSTTGRNIQTNFNIVYYTVYEHFINEFFAFFEKEKPKHQVIKIYPILTDKLYEDVTNHV